MKKNFLSIALLIGALQLAPIEAGREKKGHKESGSQSSRQRRTLATHTGVEEPTEEPMGSSSDDLDETTSEFEGRRISRRSGPDGGPERAPRKRLVDRPMGGRIGEPTRRFAGGEGWGEGPDPVEGGHIGMQDPIAWELNRWGEESEPSYYHPEYQQITLEEVAKRDISLLKEFSVVPCLKDIIKSIEKKVREFTTERGSMSKRLATRQAVANRELTRQEQRVIQLMRVLEHISSHEIVHGRGDHGRYEGHRPGVYRGGEEGRLEIEIRKRPERTEEGDDHFVRREREPRRPERKLSETTRTAKELPKKAVNEEVRRKVAAPAPVKK